MMLVGPMKKKLVSTVILVIVILTIVFGGLGYFLLSAKQNEITELKKKAEVIQKYVFAKDFPSGHVIDKGDLALVSVKSESTPGNSYAARTNVTPANREEIYRITGTTYKTGESVDSLSLIVGRKTKINVSKNTILTQEMLVDVDKAPTADLRLEEFTMINLPSDTVDGEYVDVRIMFPTGADFSVLIGKKIEKYTESSIFLSLTEDEILTMGSAIVEAYMNEGTKIYATKYVDPFNQLYTHSKVDYVAKYKDSVEKIIELREKDNLDKLVERLESEQSEEYLLMVENNPEGYMEEIAEKYEDEISVSANDITAQEIAKYIGLTEYETDEIKVAIEKNDEKQIEKYENKIVSTRKQLERTYPVNENVLEVIKTNPNILQEVKNNFDKVALINSQVAKIDQSILDDENYSVEAYNKLVSKVAEEVQLQKDERIKYLNSLIAE